MMEEKLKDIFADTVVFKDPRRNKDIANQGIPSFLRDWLIKKFSDDKGEVNWETLQSFIQKHLPPKTAWESLKQAMAQEYQRVKILAKVRLELDVPTGEMLFSLPDFGFPSRKYEAIVDPFLAKEKRDLLLENPEVWGVIELEWRLYAPQGKKEQGTIFMTDFKPFRPYRVELRYFQEASAKFSFEEWIDVLLGAIDYNPQGFASLPQKFLFLARLIPFVEKRANLIELAPKGTGKSYLFSQISKYGWLISGGSITRARLFYDIQKRQPGLIARYDYIALDEIQSISFPDKEEIRGALKGYLESGEFRVGTYHGTAQAGFILLGNIRQELMDVYQNMFQELPQVFHESALLDRFHGFIKGWELPRMKENLKAFGWALNTEYFSEIMHLLRSDVRYLALVDELLDYSPTADTRDITAIKKITTGFLKLLMPYAPLKPESINRDLFRKYCLEPAIKMRGIIRRQLNIIDGKEYKPDLPEISVIRTS
ncbi:BREX system Lon protease-like protein BrxL [Thermodesulfatator autotrophicus]|uniref:ATP-dependent protease n=1 Tax=Thermodesulfatator autotrophicus TaxID=1795632 RepID=A0A177E6R2_9BACT|nr:BREX system Lon protease-like protein BrxL [Thermodesulfatator autotrophicus]OAG27653.1 ATP-dependent protease [Thermodesulfatator autotrophicus]